MEKLFSDNGTATRTHLISIGDLSRLSGVNVKSLRYYKKIRILNPVYVDPDSRYRCYACSQAQLVISIQFYVDLGIPLNTLHTFIDPETGAVNFGEQISYGIEIAKHRLDRLKKQIGHSEYLLSEIARGEKLLSSQEPLQFDLPAKNCRVIPVQGVITQEKYASVLHTLLTEMTQSNMPIGGDTGVLSVRSVSGRQYYVFVDIGEEAGISPEEEGRMVRIEKKSYYYRSCGFIRLGDAEEEKKAVLSSAEPNIMILTELFSSSFNYRHPVYELRWSFA